MAVQPTGTREIMPVVLSKILSLGEGKDRRRCEAIVDPTTRFEPEMQKRSDAELRALTDEYRRRFADGEALDRLLPEAFATVREAAQRVRKQRHFDEQLMGGAALHYGYIAEMKTGEGKTLTSTLPGYLNALTGRGVHVVTVNDYLARRDAEWMGAIYSFLGLSVGVILEHMAAAQRWPMYAADITYGTNNQFGFDYLRDNMTQSVAQLVQRGHSYAIVDEVDSILIDEARTPLIISGPTEQGARGYHQFAEIARRLKRNVHYEVDEGKQTIAILEKGIAQAESMLQIDNLYDALNTPLVHHLQNAVRAKELYKRDVKYLVRHNEVLIVDEFTGRVMEGRRYSEGLHQAIEAKEKVPVKEEDQTYASITLQNYFRLYEKLAGMTGTAKTEAAEFSHIYKLTVVEIPTHEPMIRKDLSDVIYKNEQEKFKALADEIAKRHENGNGQPMLVGTISIEKSERLSQLLHSRGVKHNVLNAKHHEKEAHVIAQAGQLGAVTVATNMAGRGVDIMLGGNVEYLAEESLRTAGMDPETTSPEEWNEAWQAAIQKNVGEVKRNREQVVAKGGLAVIGTERHESRRIDNQLRGRSGRQGDPGQSKFFLSLEDDLMRMFASKAVANIMDRVALPDDEPISHKLVTRAIANAQRQVESRNFEIRKDVLKYDEVLNKQREVIYAIRRQVLEGEDPTERVHNMLVEVVSGRVDAYAPLGAYPEDWDLDGLLLALSNIHRDFPLRIGRALIDFEVLDREAVVVLLVAAAGKAHNALALDAGFERLPEVKVLELLNRYARSDATRERWRLDRLFSDLTAKYPTFQAEFNSDLEEEGLELEDLDRAMLHDAVERAVGRAAETRATELGFQLKGKFRTDLVTSLLDKYAAASDAPSEQDLNSAFGELSYTYPTHFSLELGKQLIELQKGLDHDGLQDVAINLAIDAYDERARTYGPQGVGEFDAAHIRGMVDKYAWAKAEPSEWRLDALFEELIAMYPTFPIELGKVSGAVDPSDPVANASRVWMAAERAYEAYVMQLGRERVGGYSSKAVAAYSKSYVESQDGEDAAKRDLPWLFSMLSAIYPVFPIAASKSFLDLENTNRDAFEKIVLETAELAHETHMRKLFEKLQLEVLLSMYDQHWREHLYEMEYLREGIGLRAIGQRDPLVEYQREAYDMFEAMLEAVKDDTVTYVFNASPRALKDTEEQRRAVSRQRLRLSSALVDDGAGVDEKTVERNEPCWCGSGRKYKKCHGATSQGAVRV
jgi:preprotein translocase subunit SecA